MKTHIRLFGKYVFNVLIALDKLLNALTGGHPHEMLSSRLGKDRDRGCIISCVLCRFLNIFEADHCTKSIARDRARRPSHYNNVDKNNRV